ncbi:MAG: hypothetical protein E2O86_05600 [Bacteroidetes bacterium]|nr:MAG: hypothetical protein E2O86_05600 [Bacteroidota bacterium]
MKKSTIRKLLSGTIIALLILVAFGYYRLGGLNSILVETITVDNYYLVGRYFEATYKSDTIRAYFEEMKEYLKDGVLTGHPVIIYDQEPSGSRGKATGFIGIKLVERPSSSLYKLEKREVPAKRSIRVSKDAHISVMPNPNKIDRLIKDYALTHALVVGDFNIEIYHPNNRLVIERPILDGVD